MKLLPGNLSGGQVFVERADGPAPVQLLCFRDSATFPCTCATALKFNTGTASFFRRHWRHVMLLQMRIVVLVVALTVSATLNHAHL
jgi:hypothetical protein